MKKLIPMLCTIGLFSSLSLRAAEPAPPDAPDSSPAPPPPTETNQAPATATSEDDATPPPPPLMMGQADSGTNGLRLNFRGAPLNLVLDYLSDAAGFIINKQADVKGTVEVWSHLVVADGVEVILEPGRSDLSPEKTRAFFRAVAREFERIRNGDEER